MVDDPATDAIVSWGAPDNSFVVWNTTAFARDLVPKYFKHNNFSSFVLQLDTYMTFVHCNSLIHCHCFSSRCDWSEVDGRYWKAEDVDTIYALPLLVPKLLHSTRKWYFSSINEKAQEIDHKFQDQKQKKVAAELLEKSTVFGRSSF